MGKQLTKQQAILKYKYEILPSVVKEYGPDDQETIEMTWDVYLKTLYIDYLIGEYSMKTWTYPKKLLGDLKNYL